MKNIKCIVLLLAMISGAQALAQQDPQFTHYMYNTMTINPAYAGQRQTLSITGLNRTQWVGIDGAPRTLTFGAHTPLENDQIGIGINTVLDGLGPANEVYVDGNFSYTIPISYRTPTKLSFGIKAGIHQLSTDWSKGEFQNPDVAFNQNISLLSPTVGAGLYLHSEKWYVGLSVPNFIKTEHYDDFSESIATERMHFFFIAGMVFDLSDSIKFKPSVFAKAVEGAPMIIDASTNFLIHNKFTVGVAWRWDDSVSAMTGFQVTESLMIGYGYDYTTTGLSNYNSGTHEILLRFELPKPGRFISPRFF